jgi:hypothetical protein
MSFKTIKLSELFPELSSLGGRDLGELVREKVEQLLKGGSKVAVDFKGFQIINHGFADELFGVLIEEYGWEFVKANVKPVNVNNAIKAVLKTVVAFRRISSYPYK